MDSNMVTPMEPELSGVKRRKGISGSTLKLVAIITMLIDHTAATILDRTLAARGMGNLNAADIQAVQKFLIENGLIYYTDTIMRLIGRLAFPIFCFLLVEGFTHTRSRIKYAARLAVFALVSEVPFDLAFYSEFFNKGHQNVFFTLLIGLLVMMGFHMISETLGDKKWLPVLAVGGAIAVGYTLSFAVKGIIAYFNIFLSSFGLSTMNLSDTKTNLLTAVFSLIALMIYIIMCKKSSLRNASIRFADLLILFAGMALAEVLKTDYSAFGILTIAVIYGLRRKPVKSMLGGCITLTIMNFSEFTSFFDLILIHFYNGTRGFRLKYVFYLFYPVHLLVLYLICYFMNLI